MDEMQQGGSVEYPIDGVLDLHMFQPGDVRSVLEEYLAVCREHGIITVRIIHGKGVGVQRRIVASVLAGHPFVRSYRTASDSSGWGATIAELEPKNADA